MENKREREMMITTLNAAEPNQAKNSQLRRAESKRQSEMGCILEAGKHLGSRTYPKANYEPKA